MAEAARETNIYTGLKVNPVTRIKIKVWILRMTIENDKTLAFSYPSYKGKDLMTKLLNILSINFLILTKKRFHLMCGANATAKMLKAHIPRQKSRT